MKFESTAAEFKTVPASERRRRRKKKHDTGPLRYRTINTNRYITVSLENKMQIYRFRHLNQVRLVQTVLILIISTNNYNY